MNIQITKYYFKKYIFFCCYLFHKHLYGIFYIYFNKLAKSTVFQSKPQSCFFHCKAKCGKLSTN